MQFCVFKLCALAYVGPSVLPLIAKREIELFCLLNFLVPCHISLCREKTFHFLFTYSLRVSKGTPNSLGTVKQRSLVPCWSGAHLVIIRILI